MVFDYREHGLRCGRLLLRVMVSLVVSRLVSWSFLACDRHVHVLTQLRVSGHSSRVGEHISRVREHSSRVGEQSFRVGDTALVTVVSLPVVAQQMRLLGRKCSGYSIHLAHLQDFDFPVVAQRFPMVQTFRFFLILLPVAVHVVVVPVVQLLQVPQMQL